MNKLSAALRFCAAALCLFLLCGCTLMNFDTPEDQLAAEQAREAKRIQVQAKVDPAAMKLADQSFDKELVNSQGTLLAAYRVTLPHFSESGLKKESFSRINQYYTQEFEGLSQDADAFLESAKALYGEGWDQIAQAETRPGVAISYELTEAPEEYLCVRCDYSVWENGQNDRYSACTVFLLDNGWELTLETLFGSHYEEAAPKLMQDILSWCEDNAVEVIQPERLQISDFAFGYGITRTALIFYSQPFQLNNSDGTRYEIRIPLSNYLALLADASK